MESEFGETKGSAETGTDRRSGTDFDYVTRVYGHPADIPRDGWDALLSLESDPSPFMRLEYLAAMHDSGSATVASGWQACFLTLWHGEQLVAACPLYLKQHSYGEYVFDWAWARAHEQHGLAYYPKALVAVPFTPVPGARLLARNDATRGALIQALLRFCQDQKLSSLHLLFALPRDVKACADAGLLIRQTVQFHWTNHGYSDFEHFLGSLRQDKRKKIRQERRKVAEAGVTFRHAQGAAITPSDWDFFYRCYERTYLEHGNPPYLSLAFFKQLAGSKPDLWLMFVAERNGRPIASSLVGIDGERRVAYGRYWGALERVECLHFEACYYQPLAWCMANGFQRFEGGAQGEHKMARALLPTRTCSAHWLAHPAFSDAVEQFLQREGTGVDFYLRELAERNPMRGNSAPQPPAIADNSRDACT